MNIHDAAKILELSGTITTEDVKQAYRKAAMTYHPDKNPAGAEMMKIINAAYDVLREFEGEIEGAGNDAGEEENYSQAVNEALNVIIVLDGLIIEICGAWVWVSGETYQHKAILKGAGFKFAGKKKSWYFRPEDWSSSSRGAYSMDDIRDKYGSSRPSRKQRTALSA